MTSIAIEELLRQSGIDDQEQLRAILGEIEALGAGDAPSPSAEVLAFMVPPTKTPQPRLGSRHRAAVIITVALAASLGMGATAAAAAIPEVRRVAHTVIDTIVHAVAPGVGTTNPPSGTRPHTGAPLPAPSSDVSGGGSVAPSSGSAPTSTTAPSSPPKGTTVPANPRATTAPAVPPAQGPKGQHSPPARPHAP